MNPHKFKVFPTQDYNCLTCIKCDIGSWTNIESLMKHSSWRDRGLKAEFVVKNFYSSLKDIDNLRQTTVKYFHENNNTYPPIAHNDTIYLVDNHLASAGTILSILVCDFSEEEWLVQDILK